MSKFKTSYAAWSCVAALVSFAILYTVAPYDALLDLATAMAFAAAFAGTVRYAVDAFWAFRAGRRGGEFLIVAMFSILALLVVQRGWVWFVNANTLPNGQRPEWLLQNGMSVLIPWMLCWASGLALFAPDVGAPQPGERSYLWRSVALFVAGAAAGFALAGTYRLPAPGPSVVIGGRAVCSPMAPVWGSSNGVYHVPTSPYRGMVRSGWCFRSVAEAQAAGFRAPQSAPPGE